MQDWLVFLRQSGAMAGIPLAVAGICLMVFGWRMWKICVMLAFGLIGATVGSQLGGNSSDSNLYAIGLGIILAVLSYWPVNLAVSSLGGIAGGAATHFFLGAIGVSGVPLWSACAAGVFAAGAYSFLQRQYVVVMMTSVMGAMLLLSGVTAWLVALPALYSTLYTLADRSVIVAPFLLLVPTTASCFYQMAEIRRFETSI